MSNLKTKNPNSNLTHNELVDNQFGSQALRYLTSSVHAQGPEFAIVEQTVQQFDTPQVLDVGSGSGHISFYASPFASKVVAYDLSQDMLNVVEQTAIERGLDNISTEQGVAELLPFEDDRFDVVISRFSAHHWQDVTQALQQMRRVCKPNGIIIMIDIMAPANPVCDTFLQTIEILRDNSHVCDYSASDWQTMFALAGLQVTQVQTHKVTLEFDSWVTRMRTPEHFVTSIRALQQNVGKEAIDYFNVQQDGTFTPDVITIIAKP